MGDEVNWVKRLAEAERVFQDSRLFGEWLQTHAQGVVGVPQNCEACPLAAWLDEAVGGQWVVTPVQYGEAACMGMGMLPAWARVFVECLDDRYGASEAVTGETALLVLREVVR